MSDNQEVFVRMVTAINDCHALAAQLKIATSPSRKGTKVCLITGFNIQCHGANLSDLSAEDRDRFLGWYSKIRWIVHYEGDYPKKTEGVKRRGMHNKRRKEFRFSNISISPQIFVQHLSDVLYLVPCAVYDILNPRRCTTTYIFCIFFFHPTPKNW